MKKQLGLLLGFLFWANIAIAAFPPFKAQDIRLEGMQHVEPGVVFRNFPISTGDLVTQQGLSAAVKRLYKSGYFQDIEVENEAGVLILKVIERPSVGKIRIEGNKAIKTEALKKGLNSAGLKEGIVFKRSALERITTELKTVYASQGRYNAKIKTEIEPIGGNRVAVNIEIVEGRVALIKHINIVGNAVYSDDTLKDFFETSLPSMWSWFSKSGRYSREKLSADIEKMRSYYLNSGYINFKVTSTQVSISPDKRSVFISLNVEEGVKYSIGQIAVKGELVVAESVIREGLNFKTGDTFSRQKITSSREEMVNILGKSGYMFASIQPVPDATSGNTVDVEFYLNPGKRTYVRRINIKGNDKTADLVIRRQMQQMESALASTEKITKSKERLDRSGYFSNVSIGTTAVPGTDDQIDVDLTVEERASGNFTASVGFSQTESFILEFGISQDNFLGTGNRVSASLSQSDVKKEVRLDYTNPFYTVDGVSRGFDFYLKKEDFDESSSSKYKIDEYGVGVTFGYPINEYQRISARFGVENITIDPNTETSQEVSRYISDNGDKFTSTNTTLYWTENKLNRRLFPTSGRKQSVSLELSLPGSDLNYYKLRYNGAWIKSLSVNEKWLIGARGNLGYADSIGKDDFPFFKNFFAGGIGSMRGVSGNSLGPRDTPKVGAADQNSDPFGGNVLITGGVDFIFPLLGVDDATKYRTSLFLDYGGIYATKCLVSGANCNTGVELSDVKYSAGLGFTWLTPVGPLTFSYAKLLNKEVNDDEKTFDFTLGGSF